MRHAAAQPRPSAPIWASSKSGMSRAGGADVVLSLAAVHRISRQLAMFVLVALIDSFLISDSLIFAHMSECATWLSLLDNANANTFPARIPATHSPSTGICSHLQANASPRSPELSKTLSIPSLASKLGSCQMWKSWRDDGWRSRS